jgi:hypothetical protein
MAATVLNSSRAVLDDNTRKQFEQVFEAILVCPGHQEGSSKVSPAHELRAALPIKNRLVL